MLSSLDSPPFPPLQWDNYRWVGALSLPAWAEFKMPDAESEPSVELGVQTPGEQPSAPSPAQAAAFEFLMEHQERVREAILSQLLAEYPQWQDDFGYDEAEKAEFMPDVSATAQFKPLLELTGITIFSTEKAACAYVGVLCDCIWDPEHAFGAMVHRERVVQIGGADSAILEWIAQEDAASSE